MPNSESTATTPRQTAWQTLCALIMLAAPVVPLAIAETLDFPFLRLRIFARPFYLVHHYLLEVREAFHADYRLAVYEVRRGGENARVQRLMPVLFHRRLVFP